MRMEHVWRGATLVALMGWALAGCGSGSDEPYDVSARGAREEAQGPFDTEPAYGELRAVEQRAQRLLDDAGHEIERARQELADASAGARRELEAALDRTEDAREALRGELEDLRTEGSESARQRVSDALIELAEARREIGEVLAGEERGAG